VNDVSSSPKKTAKALKTYILKQLISTTFLLTQTYNFYLVHTFSE